MQQAIKRMLIDRREPKLLKLLEDISYSYELQFGDLFIEDRFGRTYYGERKTAGDFLSSISSGRLYHQAKGILSSDFPFIILEGHFRPTPDGMTRADGFFTKWRYSSVQGHIIDLFLKGIAVIPTEDIASTAATIRTLYSQVNSDKKFDIRRPRLFHYRSDATEDEKAAEEVICSLPGINVTLGDKLWEHFDTPRGIFIASKDELDGCPDIGEARASRIERVLNTKHRRVSDAPNRA